MHKALEEGHMINLMSLSFDDFQVERSCEDQKYAHVVLLFSLLVEPIQFFQPWSQTRSHI